VGRDDRGHLFDFGADQRASCIWKLTRQHRAQAPIVSDPTGPHVPGGARVGVRLGRGCLYGDPRLDRHVIGLSRRHLVSHVALAWDLLRLRIAIIGHVSVGVGLVAWILLEAAWVVVSPGLQGTFGVIGLVIFVLGLREVRRVPAMRGGVMSASAGRESDPHLKSRGRWYLRCPGGGWTAPHAELESRAKRGGWPRDCQPASRDASRSDR
jgi:hypothetical protein